MEHLCFHKLLFFVAIAAFALVPAPAAGALTTTVKVNATGSVTFDKAAELGGKVPATLYWNKVQTDNVLTGAYKSNPAGSGGYVAWGFTPKLKGISAGDNMAGSSIYVSFQDTSGVWSVVEYYLAGKKETSVYIAQTLDTKSVGAYYDGKDVVLTFTIQLNSTLVSSPHIIWSTGSMKDAASKRISKHSFGTYGVQDFDWSKGGGKAAGSSSKEEKLRKFHAWSATVGWGVMLPIGILYARYLRPVTKSLWYNVHRFNQMLGVLLGLISFAVGLYLTHLTGNEYDEHKMFGWAVVAVCLLMITAFIFRPAKGNKKRPTWNVLHHSLGYISIGLIIYNIHLGFDIYGVKDGVKWVYWWFLVAVGCLAIIMEFVYLWKFGLKWYSLSGDEYPWGEEKKAHYPDDRAPAPIYV